MPSSRAPRHLLPSVLKILLIIFVTETLVMFLLPVILPDRTSALGGALINALLLTVLSSPFVWWLALRPVRTAAEHDRVREVEQLRYRSEQDWEDTFNTITDMITIHDKDFNIIRANKAAEKILKLPLLMTSRVKCFEHYHGTACPPEGCPSCGSLVTGKPVAFELFEPHLNMFIEIRAIPRLDAENNVVGLIHVVRDITARKRLEEDLLKSTNHLRAIIETVPECVKLLAADGTLIDMNPAGLAMLEADFLAQLSGKSVDPIILPAYRSAFHALTKSVFRGESGTLEFELLSLKGARRWVETRAVPLREANGAITAVLAVTRDITERKTLETQLRHAHKMEAVGTLTGGIAHDFNNILTAIIGYSNIVKLKLGPDDPARPFVDRIIASSERATALTQSLLAFSRRVVTTMRPVNLNETVQRAVQLLHQFIGENIRLKTELTGGITTVTADAGQIEQVLMNLAANARDAMPDGGTLTITTGLGELGDDFVRTYGHGKPGAYAVITVADTGAGMDDATRERIFEPFFTTKEVGKGTGLGLSIVYGLIKSHAGYINCGSRPGQGTTFTIYLPLAKETPREYEAQPSSIPRGGTESILIAGEDPVVRKLTAALLRDFGYTIVEAEDGEDAVLRFREKRDDIRLLLFDDVMPKQDGQVAYHAIKRMSPDVKVLFMRGCNTAALSQKGLTGELAPFIPKPVSPETLLKKVREVLEHD